MPTEKPIERPIIRIWSIGKATGKGLEKTQQAFGK